jgi:hypothetical protein
VLEEDEYRPVARHGADDVIPEGGLDGLGHDGAGPPGGWR